MSKNGSHGQFNLRSGGSLRGEVTVPGDKSISHRAVMLAAIAQGKSEIRNWLAAGDTEATLGAMRDLGVIVERHDANTLSIHGGSLREADGSLEPAECGHRYSPSRRFDGGADFSQRT